MNQPANQTKPPKPVKPTSQPTNWPTKDLSPFCGTPFLTALASHPWWILLFTSGELHATFHTTQRTAEDGRSCIVPGKQFHGWLLGNTVASGFGALCSHYKGVFLLSLTSVPIFLDGCQPPLLPLYVGHTKSHEHISFMLMQSKHPIWFTGDVLSLFYDISRTVQPFLPTLHKLQ
jgi:hypothetical protein